MNVTGITDAGFFSRGGILTSQPMDNDKVMYGQCPKGHYCPAGSENPTPCPAGTYGLVFSPHFNLYLIIDPYLKLDHSYRDSWRLTVVTSCKQCTPGYFCSALNMSSIGAQCTAGYFCSGGSPTATPVNSTYGGVCPTGNTCSTGTSIPVPCPAGQYQNTTGKTTCKVT